MQDLIFARVMPFILLNAMFGANAEFKYYRIYFYKHSLTVLSKFSYFQ